MYIDCPRETNFYGVPMKFFLNGLSLLKCLSRRFRKYLPMLMLVIYWSRFLMPWTRGQIDYPHVKESFWGEQKYIWWSPKKNRFQGRLEYVNPGNSGSNARSSRSGTHSLVKVGDTNNSHSNSGGKNRNRRLIWFNPPFCKLTNINVSKYLLNLLDRY